MGSDSEAKDEAGLESPQVEPVFEGSRYIREAYERVPSRGDGRRWYDGPYRVLSWLSSSWRRRILPRRVLRWLNYGTNYLIPFNEHDRHKIWSLDDPSKNLTVPADEHVTMPGIWVVELFPPSEFSALERTIKRNSWDRSRRYLDHQEGNREMLERSRSGAGWSWWRLAEIAGTQSSYWFPDGSREKLPAEFGAVELQAIQIGTGLTAVLAYFHLTDEAARSLDKAWHTRHEPQLLRGKGRPRAEDRLWASYRLTQEARRELHDAARGWMARRCPGYFTSQGEPPLLMDILLLDKHDPIPGERTSREYSDALRALGLTGHDVEHRTSPDLAHVLLSPVDGTLCRGLEPKRTWALWGSRDAIAAANKDLDIYGSDENRAVAHAAHERMRNFLVVLAVSEFLAITEAQYATLRDGARTRHGTFKARGLERLRASFLTLSLDLTSVARDVEAFWSRKWRDEGDARFEVDYAGWIIAMDEKEGRKRRPPINMNEELRKSQRKWFKKLIAADRDYREILSTVASLGASVNAFKIGRAALWIALASLTVAVGTLLVTDVGDHTTLGKVGFWVHDLLDR